jgi:hypothetical protein
MVSGAGQQKDIDMTTMDQEPPASGSASDPALHIRLRDPVFNRAFDEYRDMLTRRALWASAKRGSRRPRGRDRGALAG